MAGNILDVHLKEALENSNCKWKDEKSFKVIDEFTKVRGYDLDTYPLNVLEMRCMLCGLVEPVKKGKGRKHTVKWKE